MTLAPGALAVTLGASLAWSGFDSLRKALVRRLAPLPLLFLLTAASLPALAIWAAVDGRVALALQLLALSLVWVSWVETMKRGIGNLMAVVLGRLAFGEAVTAAKLLAVGLIAAGVALILI